ncbi:helix-turn-helix domain-containing protein [Gluconacetobacter diazotrophicus]|uniref:helix-turn-helix domain-containing protein n=1 Tax=Gluconacetobacter diazotrophicus TaxID=33996 RepID=UPI0011A7E700|nr:helix-turn-helix domain-containing protein [Gluconacetobacter diazotrophicus]
MANIIGSRLASARRHFGDKRGRRATVQESADAVGIGRSTLSVYENGHDTPGLQTLVALADFYDVSIDYLLGRSSAPLGCSDDIAKDDDERALLSAWRDITDEDRAALRVALRNAKIAADRAA